MTVAHQHLLDAGGVDNLWEDGWLREQLAVPVSAVGADPGLSPRRPPRR